jgi:ribonuclease P protein component
MASDAFPVRRQTFRKLEKLVSRKSIEQLAASGRSVHAGPFRLVWMKVEADLPYPAQVAFSVPKRNIRLSVDRNRIKRLMRESYRKNKDLLYTFLEERKCRVVLLMIFTGRSLPSHPETEEKLKLTLQRFVEDFQKHSV